MNSSDANIAVFVDLQLATSYLVSTNKQIRILFVSVIRHVVESHIIECFIDQTLEVSQDYHLKHQ